MRPIHGLIHYRQECLAMPAKIRLPSGLHAMLLLVAMGFLSACSSSAVRQDDPLAPPWTEQGAPARLTRLVEDLSAFQQATNRMPRDLAELTRSGLGNQADGKPMPNFAYHPANLAVLRDGWRVVAVDDRRDEDSRAWCVVRAPVRLGGEPLLRVVLVPLGELRLAVVAAGP